MVGYADKRSKKDDFFCQFEYILQTLKCPS